MFVNIPSVLRRKFVVLIVIFIVIACVNFIIQYQFTFKNQVKTKTNYHNVTIRISHLVKYNNLLRQQSHSTKSLSSVQRAILIFFPSDQDSHYLPELRWLYRSWLEMMTAESADWRTDLIIFTGDFMSSFAELGCVLNQVRTNDTEPPRCRVFLYLRLSLRQPSAIFHTHTTLANGGRKEFFHIDTARSAEFYDLIRDYGYFDSVNIIAEGYPVFSYYDFILKTDIDIFLTTQFGRFVPITDNSLLYGLGGYSMDFNTRRLGRVARDLGWDYQNMTNIGSTWYGPPIVAQRTANFTLDAMLHLAKFEFSIIERENKLGVLHWPEWHYGVLTMYGTHMAVNHLSTRDRLDFRKAGELLDQSTTTDDQHDLEKNTRLHLHCWHTEKSFSKFAFKEDEYNRIHPRTLIKNTSPQAYAMRMALESRLMTLKKLAQRLDDMGRTKKRRS